MATKITRNAKTTGNGGNRLTSGDSGQASQGDDEYVANAGNQYDSRENNTVRLTGTAGAGANVAVTGSFSVSKRDRAWYATSNRAASDPAHQTTATIYAALPGQGSGGNDIVQSGARGYFVPKQNQSFGYDYAGNLTRDSVWDYTYDAENRLVAMQTRDEVIGTGMLATADARRLEFTYDYLGRRVQKVVKKWNGTSYGTIDSSRKYLYDGWNLIAEFDAVSTLTLVRSYTWGLDLAGSLTASGGVGALLQVRDEAKSRTWLPTYDGNGNVVSLLDAESGGSASIAAVFEYGPFGEPLRTQINDADAKDVPFRFSAKFTDIETGLVYYGLRYYSPTLGRFINKDPIEEKGGLNLYGFCRNDGVNGSDLLGLFLVRRCYWWQPTGGQPDYTKLYCHYEDISGGGDVITTSRTPNEGGGSGGNSGTSSTTASTNIGDNFKKCVDLAQTISRLETQTRATIADFSNLRGYFSGANTANNLALGQKTFFAGLALTSLSVGLLENAEATALGVLPAEEGFLPGVITASGRLVGIGNPAFKATLQAAATARNVGATVVGVQSIVPDATMFAGEHAGVQRIVDPAGTYAEESIERGDELSQQQAETVKVMQDSLRSAKEKYKSECGQ